MSGGKIMNDCGEPIKGLEKEDMNGDGQPELLFGDAGICSGNAGFFTIVTRGPKGAWRQILSTTGIYEFLPVRHLGWPDIQTGGPGCDGSDPKFRWNGTRYVENESTPQRCTTASDRDNPGVTASGTSGSSAVPHRPAGNISYYAATGTEGYVIRYDLVLAVSGVQITGSRRTVVGIFSHEEPVTGTYSEGQCDIFLKKERLIGPCNDHVFQAESYSLKNTRKLASLLYATGEYWSAQQSANGPPPAEQATPAEQPVRTGRIVTTIGRARLLVEPGGRCGPDTMLLKGYCFEEAIGILERDPRKKDITVIATHQRLPLGARIGSGEYRYVEVKRRKEGGYYADKDLHGYSKTQPPPGCIFQASGNDGFIIDIAEGRKAAIEVTDYSCP